MQNFAVKSKICIISQNAKFVNYYFNLFILNLHNYIKYNNLLFTSLGAIIFFLTLLEFTL